MDLKLCFAELALSLFMVHDQNKSTCFAECWTGTIDRHGFEGVARNLTLSQCKAACENNSTCVAVDWEPGNAGKTCWILTSTETRETENPGVITHYVLNRPCLSE